jgi:hypothetical protein
VEEVVGYYETGGPKMGRDYSDPLLREQLTESLLYLKKRIESYQGTEHRQAEPVFTEEQT